MNIPDELRKLADQMDSRKFPQVNVEVHLSHTDRPVIQSFATFEVLKLGTFGREVQVFMDRDHVRLLRDLLCERCQTLDEEAAQEEIENQDIEELAKEL